MVWMQVHFKPCCFVMLEILALFALGFHSSWISIHRNRSYNDAKIANRSSSSLNTFINYLPSDSRSPILGISAGEGIVLSAGFTDMSVCATGLDGRVLFTLETVSWYKLEDSL
jgi:hypothetical protein